MGILMKKPQFTLANVVSVLSIVSFIFIAHLHIGTKKADAVNLNNHISRVERKWKKDDLRDFRQQKWQIEQRLGFNNAQRDKEYIEILDEISDLKDELKGK